MAQTFLTQPAPMLSSIRKPGKGQRPIARRQLPALDLSKVPAGDALGMFKGKKKKTTVPGLRQGMRGGEPPTALGGR